MSTAIVEGLDWFGAATPSSIWSGSFFVAPTPGSAAQPSDLIVRSISIRGISPIFHISIDRTDNSKLIVQFVVPIGGTFPVTLAFRDSQLGPPQGGNWNLYSNDASLSLTEYIPGVPPVSAGFTISSQSGVQASVQGNTLNFTKTTSQATGNQWAAVEWALPSLSTGPPPPGLFLIYRVRWKSLGGTWEVKLHAPSFVHPSKDECALLRFSGGGVNWEVYDGRIGDFISQNSSNISANGEWHDILFYASSDTMRIYEDGRNVMAMARGDRVLGFFKIRYNVYAATGFFDSDLMGFKTCPAGFHHDLPGLISIPAELVFNSASSVLNRQYFTVSSWNGPILVTQTEDSLRFYTPKLTQQNCTVSTYYTQTLPTYSVVQYRFKVNASGGHETKVTIAGGLILRIYDGIPRWQSVVNGNFVTLSDVTNFRIGGPYVSVLVIVSSSLVTLFEDGQFMFEHHANQQNKSNFAIFHVQHLEVNYEVDVELSHLRVISGA